MSIYRIDQDSNEDRIALVKLSGRAQAETIIKLLDELNALAECDPAARVLIDESDLGAGVVGPRDIGRIAVFATNPVIIGLNRRFQGLATGADGVSVFNDRARAVAWLLEG